MNLILDLVKQNNSPIPFIPTQNDATKEFNIGDYILVKCLYNAGTKKEIYKFYPCLIKDNQSITIYVCQFLRSYKGSKDKFIFPTVDDVEEVNVENIISGLIVEDEHRGRIPFNM